MFCNFTQFTVCPPISINELFCSSKIFQKATLFNQTSCGHMKLHKSRDNNKYPKSPQIPRVLPTKNESQRPKKHVGLETAKMGIRELEQLDCLYDLQETLSIPKDLNHVFREKNRSFTTF